MLHREARRYTRICLRGKYGRALGGVLLLGGGMLLFRLVPGVIGTWIVWQGAMTWQTLLASGTGLWLSFWLLWQCLRFGVMTPVQCAVLSWYTDMLHLGMPDGRRIFFAGLRDWMRGMGFFLCTELCRFAVWLPFVLGLRGAGFCLTESFAHEEDSIWLFAAVQCLCLVFWGAVLAVRYGLGAAAVPVLFLSDRSITPWRAMRRSQQMMQGRRLSAAGLQLLFCAAAFVPFRLPHALIQYVLFLQIRLREWQQSEEREHAKARIHHEAGTALHA